MKYLIPLLFLWVFTSPCFTQDAKVSFQQSIRNNQFIPLMVDLTEEEDPMLIGKAIENKNNYYSPEAGIPVIGLVKEGAIIDQTAPIELPEKKGSYYSIFSRKGTHCFFPLRSRLRFEEEMTAFDILEKGEYDIAFDIIEANDEGELVDRHPLFQRTYRPNFGYHKGDTLVKHYVYQSEDHRYIGVVEIHQRKLQDLRFEVSVFDIQTLTFWSKQYTVENATLELSRLLAVHLSNLGTFQLVLVSQEQEGEELDFTSIRISKDRVNEKRLDGPDYMGAFQSAHISTSDHQSLIVALLPINNEGGDQLFFWQINQSTNQVEKEDLINLTRQDFSNYERLTTGLMAGNRGFTKTCRDLRLLAHPSGELTIITQIGNYPSYQVGSGSNFFSSFEILRFSSSGEKLWTKVLPHCLRVDPSRHETSFPYYFLHEEDLYIFHNVTDKAFAWSEAKLPNIKIGSVSKKNIMYPAVWKVEADGEAKRSRVWNCPRIPIQFEYAVRVDPHSFYFYANNYYTPDEPAIIGLITVE